MTMRRPRATSRRAATGKRHQLSPERERQARLDLAAAHRLSGLLGWTNIIYNHISLRIPDEPDCFLFKPHELMFEEVTASSLMKMDLQGHVLAPVGGKSNPGFNLHAAILAARSDVNCVVHVHTEEGMALSARRGGLMPISQDAMHFYNRIAYHDYDGLATGETGRNRLVDDLGSRRAMILRNHGLLTCADSVATAIILMKYLVSSCRTQLMLEATHAELVTPSAESCEATARQWDKYYETTPPQAEWAALIRWADRVDRGFRR